MEKGQTGARESIASARFLLRQGLALDDSGDGLRQAFVALVLGDDFSFAVEQVARGREVDVVLFGQVRFPALAVIEVRPGELFFGDKVVELLAVGVERNPDNDEALLLVFLRQFFK